jgi:hypothetical protein
MQNVVWYNVCNPLEYQFPYLFITGGKVILAVRPFLLCAEFPATHIPCFPPSVVNYKSNFPVPQGRARIMQTIMFDSNKGSQPQLQSVPNTFPSSEKPTQNFSCLTPLHALWNLKLLYHFLQTQRKCNEKLTLHFIKQHALKTYGEMDV